MIQAAKLVIIDSNDQYLMMYRDNHPVFGNDPDLPGGTLEDGESPTEAMIREVYEEAKIVIREDETRLAYEETNHIGSGRHYCLFVAELDHRPDITMSWEHASYEWLDREKFLQQAKNANDSFMHMVYRALK